MLAGITTIIFDLGGVLMDLDKASCIKAFKKIGFDDIDQYVNDYAQKGMFKELEQGKISLNEFHDQIREHIGKAVTDEQIDGAFREFLGGIPDYKLALLRKLRGFYNLLLLSNTNVLMMDYAEKHYFADEGLHIHDYFDYLFLSYEMKMTKPDPAILRKIIEETGIHPQNTLYLDDSKKNLEVAVPFGFHTYWVQPHENFSSLFGVE